MDVSIEDYRDCSTDGSLFLRIGINETVIETPISNDQLFSIMTVIDEWLVSEKYKDLV